MSIKRSVFVFVILLFSITVYSQNYNIDYIFPKSFKNTNVINASKDYGFFSQSNAKRTSKFLDDYYPTLAVNYNFDYFFSFEPGIYTGGFIGPDTKKARGFLGIGNEYSLEIYTNFDDKVIAGPKYTLFFLFAVVEAGLSAAFYTDFKDQANLSLRPFIGFSFLGALCLSYGYNFALTDYSFVEINFHNLQLKYRF